MSSSASIHSVDLSEEISEETLMEADVDGTKMRRPDYFHAFNGNLGLRERLNAIDYWLDHRCAVQNGARSIIVHDKQRYARTIRILKDSDKHSKLLQYARQMYIAQDELSKLTPFVQAVAAITVTKRSLVVLSPLPYNMYLSDLKRLIVHFSHASIKYYAACIVYALDFMRHRQVQHGNLCLTSIALDQFGRPAITEFDPLFSSHMTGSASAELAHKVEVFRYATLLGILFCDNVRHFTKAHMASGRDPTKKDLFNNICIKCRYSMHCVEPRECDCHNFKMLIRSILLDIVTLATINIMPRWLTYAWIETELRYSWGTRKTGIKPMGISQTAGSGLKVSNRQAKHVASPVAEEEEEAMGAAISGYELGDHDDDDSTPNRQRADSIESLAEELPAVGEQTMEQVILMKQSGRKHRSRGTMVSDQFKLGSSTSGVFQKAGELYETREPSSQPRSRRQSPSGPVQQAAESAAQSSEKRRSLQSFTERLQFSAITEEAPATAAAEDKTLPSRRSLDSTELPIVGVAADISDTTTTTPPAAARAARAAAAAPADAIIAARQVWSSSSSYAIHQGVTCASSTQAGSSIYDDNDVVDDDAEAIHNSRLSDSVSEIEDSDSSVSGAPTQLTKTTQSSEDGKPRGPFEYNSYKMIMEHPFFRSVKWAELETMPSPENFFYAHGPLVQTYCKETALTKTADSGGKDEQGGRGATAGANFTSKSRILYNLFG